MKLSTFLVNLGATFLAAIVLREVWITETWEEYLVELLFGFGGLIGFCFPDEMSSWQGYQAWHTNQWRFRPGWYIRLTGAVFLGLSAYSVLVERLSIFHRAGVTGIRRLL